MNSTAIATAMHWACWTYPLTVGSGLLLGAFPFWIAHLLWGDEVLNIGANPLEVALLTTRSRDLVDLPQPIMAWHIGCMACLLLLCFLLRPGQRKRVAGITTAFAGHAALSWVILRSLNGNIGPDVNLAVRIMDPALALCCLSIGLVLGLGIDGEPRPAFALRAAVCTVFSSVLVGVLSGSSMSMPSVLGACLMTAAVWIPGWLGAIATAATRLHVGPPFAAKRAIMAALVACISVAGILNVASAAIRAAETSSDAGIIAKASSAKPNRVSATKTFHRGVTLSDDRARYTSASGLRMLEALGNYSVDAIALVPHGQFSHDAMLGPRPARLTSQDGIAVSAAIMKAHEAGLSVLLKPHLPTPFEAERTDRAKRALWFERYHSAMLDYARIAESTSAEVLCIGVEAAGLVTEEAEWRSLIQDIRHIFKGQLVYAATFGDEVNTVPFWDALDYIGVNFYYPLSESYQREDIRQHLAAMSSRLGKPVLFTEVGFSATPGAHRRPWHNAGGGAVDVLEQERCYRAILSSFCQQEWFAGMYWWKVDTDGSGGLHNASMTPWGKPAMATMREWYAKVGRTQVRPTLTLHK